MENSISKKLTVEEKKRRIQNIRRLREYEKKLYEENKKLYKENSKNFQETITLFVQKNLIPFVLACAGLVVCKLVPQNLNRGYSNIIPYSRAPIAAISMGTISHGYYRRPDCKQIERAKRILEAEALAGPQVDEKCSRDDGDGTSKIKTAVRYEFHNRGFGPKLAYP